MPSRGFPNAAGARDAWEPDDLLPSGVPWDGSTDAINSIFPFTSNGDISNSSPVFPSSVPSGRDRLATVANNAFMNNIPQQSFDFDFYRDQHNVQLPAAEQINSSSNNSYVAPPSDWTTNFLQPAQPPHNPLTSLRQDQDLSNYGTQAGDGTSTPELRVRPLQPTKMTPNPSNPRRRNAPSRSTEAPAANTSHTISTNSPNVTTPPGPMSNPRKGQDQMSKPSPLKQAVAVPREAHQEVEGQKNMRDSRTRDVSLASSARSVQSENSAQSHLSLDFGKSDRLEDPIRTPGVLRSGQGGMARKGQQSLPDEKAFSIQIGSELFKLSGASIMSDAPSYFSAFFIEQLQQNDYRYSGVRTLFIDRDPETFRDIAQHLQGYLLSPRDGRHFVKLFADAQFYQLPRLQSQLFESEIFIEIGNENFRIPRETFSSPGDSPNFFTLGFTVFFSTPGDIFPGLNPKGLKRPPAIHPPSVPNRSPQIFRDLLHGLRGYPLTIRNKEHREELLRDAKYYNLRGLEQKLIPFEISYNIKREKPEIVVRLQDIKPSGVSFEPDSPTTDIVSAGWVTYARPYVDEVIYELIIEIDEESMAIDFGIMRADLFGLTKARISSLFQVVANKMNLPTTAPLGLYMVSGGVSTQPASPSHTPLSEDKVKISIDEEAFVTLDREEHKVQADNLFQQGQEPGPDQSNSATTEWAEFSSHFDPTPDEGSLRTPSSIPAKRALGSRRSSPARKRPRRSRGMNKADEWNIRKGQWRLRVQPRPDIRNEATAQQRDEDAPQMEIVMVAVRLDAVSGQKGRNATRSFLG